MSALQRSGSFLLAIAFLAVATILLLSDRTVSLVGTAHSFVVGAGRAIEHTFQIDVLDRSDIPGRTEHWSHAGLWGSGMLLFGWILRHRVPLPLTALGVAGASLFFEVAQPLLSTTRRFQNIDAVANMTGIAVAAVLLVPVLWAARQTAPAAVRVRH